MAVEEELTYTFLNLDQIKLVINFSDLNTLFHDQPVILKSQVDESSVAGYKPTLTPNSGPPGKIKNKEKTAATR